MVEKIMNELQKRGTCEVSGDGIATQITQAIDEKPNEVKMLMFGELVTKKIRPIKQACKICDHRHFTTIVECQKFQREDAEARGFKEVICPQQFID